MEHTQSPRERLGHAKRAVLARTPDLLRRMVEEIRDDRVPKLAAETAFFAVLSLFPSLLLAAGLLGLLDVVVGTDVSGRIRDRVTEALDTILTDQASGVTNSVQAFFEGGYNGLLTVAALGALVSLSGAWATVVEALNLAYDTEERRNWLHRRWLGLWLGLATVVIVVLTLAVVVVGPLMGQGEDLAGALGWDRAFVQVWQLMRLPVLFTVLTLWLMSVYHYAPNRDTRWLSSLPGALATAVAWLLATGGFSLYLRYVGGGNPVIGAFGGGAIVMLWMYLLSVALMVGGELNAILHQRRRTERAGSDGAGPSREAYPAHRGASERGNAAVRKARRRRRTRARAVPGDPRSRRVQ